jgi:hypothetical protein
MYRVNRFQVFDSRHISQDIHLDNKGYLRIYKKLYILYNLMLYFDIFYKGRCTQYKWNYDRYLRNYQDTLPNIMLN